MADIFQDVALSQGYRGAYSGGHLLHTAIQEFINLKVSEIVVDTDAIMAQAAATATAAAEAAIAEMPASDLELVPDPDTPGSYLIGG